VSVEELIEEVEVEFEYIETVLEELKKLVIKPVDYEPELIEITGAGGLLHNFYNGIENIFIRILKFKNIKQEESKDWHKELLKKFYDEDSNVSFLERHIYDNFLIPTISFPISVQRVINLLKRIQNNWFKQGVIKKISLHKWQPDQ